MLGGADNPNGELPSYITGADTSSPPDVNHHPLVHSETRSVSPVHQSVPHQYPRHGLAASRYSEAQPRNTPAQPQSHKHRYCPSRKWQQRVPQRSDWFFWPAVQSHNLRQVYPPHLSVHLKSLLPYSPHKKARLNQRAVITLCYLANQNL